MRYVTHYWREAIFLTRSHHRLTKQLRVVGFVRLLNQVSKYVQSEDASFQKQEKKSQLQHSAHPIKLLSQARILMMSLTEPGFVHLQVQTRPIRLKPR